MGQTIEVKSVVLGDVALFDTDRTVTGQDGHGFAAGSDAPEETTTAARLAAALFGSDPAINHVFVMSNQVTVRRTGAWRTGVCRRRQPGTNRRRLWSSYR